MTFEFSFLGMPDWIKLNLSFKRIESLSRSSGDISGLILMGGLSTLLFERILETSAILTNFTKIGLGCDRWGLNLPRRKQSLIAWD